MTASGEPVDALSRGERTRAKLLAAAREVFGEVGWAKARVEDVCRAAGVGHGTYYAYFPNRTAILVALVREHAVQLYQLVEASWSAGDVATDVHRVIDGFVTLSERDRVVRVAWFAAAPTEPVLGELVGEVRRQFVERVRTNLIAARDAGTARADLDVEVAAAALAAMVEHTVALAQVQRDEALRPDRLVAGLTDLWVHAVYRP